MKEMIDNVANIEIVNELLELPDEQFYAAYSMMKEEVDKLLSSKRAEASIRDDIRFGELDIEKERENIKKAKKSLKSLEFTTLKQMFLEQVFDKTLETVEKIYANPIEEVKVDIVLTDENAKLPTYAHFDDAAADIYALEETTINPNETKIVRTGLKMAVPVGYRVEIYLRSGVGAKTKLRLANGVGQIDSSYRGEIGLIIDNIGDTPYTIEKGERICQMMIEPVYHIGFNKVETLNSTERGEGGFGSTGKS